MLLCHTLTLSHQNNTAAALFKYLPSTNSLAAQIHFGEIFSPSVDQPEIILDLPKPTSPPLRESSTLASDKAGIEKEEGSPGQAIKSSPQTANKYQVKVKKGSQRINLQSKSDVGKALTKSDIPKHSELATRPPKGVIVPAISPSTKISMSSARLFVASLGNPAPYLSTRHSAGHVLLKALHAYLRLPPFHKSKSFANGLLAEGAEIGRPEYTLWQSPSLMNISGVALLKAYKTFTSTAQVSPTDPLPGLVVIYDEMETTPGQLRLRRGATSAKGHNGLKSVQQSLQSAGLMGKLENRFIKIGIGIGRPTGGSRSSDDVSQYVLGQLTSSEKQTIDGKADELHQLLEVEMTKLFK